jgi:hypothetical protein
MKFIGSFFLAIFMSTPLLATTSYDVASCVKNRKKMIGWRLKIEIPKGASLKESSDVDYTAYSIKFREKKNDYFLEGIHGPLASAGKVPAQWIQESDRLEKLSWQVGEVEGVDARGTLANGNSWRIVAMYGNAISYYDVPAAAANYFDRILDTACVE